MLRKIIFTKCNWIREWHRNHKPTGGSLHNSIINIWSGNSRFQHHYSRALSAQHRELITPVVLPLWWRRDTGQRSHRGNNACLTLTIKLAGRWLVSHTESTLFILCLGLWWATSESAKASCAGLEARGWRGTNGKSWWISGREGAQGWEEGHSSKRPADVAAIKGHL